MAKRLRTTFNKPGHFVGADRCGFFRHDHVGRYCISSVGDWHPISAKGARVDLGVIVEASGAHTPAFFEMMVFDLRGKTRRWNEISVCRTPNEASAIAAHEATVNVYAAQVRRDKKAKRKAERAMETVAPPGSRVGVRAKRNGAGCVDHR